VQTTAPTFVFKLGVFEKVVFHFFDQSQDLYFLSRRKTKSVQQRFEKHNKQFSHSFELFEKMHFARF